MNLHDDDDPVREAEFNDVNYERVKSAVKDALRRSGCILPEAVQDALTCTVLEESLATRRRMAYMAHCFTEHFADQGYTKDRLEHFEAVLLLHHRDQDNLGFMPNLDD